MAIIMGIFLLLVFALVIFGVKRDNELLLRSATGLILLFVLLSVLFILFLIFVLIPAM